MRHRVAFGGARQRLGLHRARRIEPAWCGAFGIVVLRHVMLGGLRPWHALVAACLAVAGRRCTVARAVAPIATRFVTARCFAAFVAPVITPLAGAAGPCARVTRVVARTALRRAAVGRAVLAGVVALGVARLARVVALVTRIAEVASFGTLLRARATRPVGMRPIKLRALAVGPVVGSLARWAARAFATLVLAVGAALAFVRAVTVLAVGGPIGARTGVARVGVAAWIGRAVVTARLEARAVAPVIAAIVPSLRARSGTVAAGRAIWPAIRPPIGSTIRAASVGWGATRVTLAARPVIRAPVVAVERALRVARAVAVTLLLAFTFGLRLAEGRPAHTATHRRAGRGTVGRRFLEFQGSHRRSGASAVRR
jgi:hypothetical protein